MKSVQIMQRDFNGNKISQRTNDKFFNATELLSIYNEASEKKKVFAEFWSNKNTKEFIEELENELLGNIGNSLCLKTHETSRGKGGATWMHPYLFVKFAMWLSPKFELAVIKWVYDNLIDYRVQAGDYYKEMCQEVQKYYLELGTSDKNPLLYSQEATMLNLMVFGTPKGKQRNEASEYELALMNDLQLSNMFLIKEKMSFQDRKTFLAKELPKIKYLLQKRLK